MRWLRWTLVAVVILSNLHAAPLLAQSPDELESKRKEIEQLEAELNRVRGEKQTLSSTVAYLEGKIKLTQAQISSSQNELAALGVEIDSLNDQIETLEESLTRVTGLLLNRVHSTYKRSRMDSWLLHAATGGLSQVVNRHKYLQSVQTNDRELLVDMELNLSNYNVQKQLKVQKQDELDLLTKKLEQQKRVLDQQQNEKAALLELTKNDERRFQTELSRKMAELEAIQSIIAGKGDEVEVGSVKQGDQIARVIPGPSTCSSGAHLHFEVAESGVHKNPADFLSPKAVSWDNSPDGSFSFNGSWPWPINDTVRITQGYGMTFYAATMRYYGGAPHTGIDMVNNQDYSVKSVKDGTLYRGAIGCRGGQLRYVRVAHDDGVSTYYLHVNY